jgi:hypothetical protein
VTKVYSKYLGTLSRFTASLRGGIQVGNMVGINLAFARSSLCLVRFSSDGWDCPAPREVDGEAGSPFIDDACTPVDIDMALSVMRSIINFLDSAQLIRHTHSGLMISGLEGNLDIAIG